MENSPIARAGAQPFFRFLSGTLMIAGTTIAAGMLGVPLVTAQAGFWPAFLITLCVWLFVLCTGLLYLEVALWMPGGTNILSISQRFLGSRGRLLLGVLLLLLYYCLMVAYFAAGAPILADFSSRILGISMSGWLSYLVFGGFFAVIVSFGSKWLIRVNFTLTIAMIAAYLILAGAGSSDAQIDRLISHNWPSFLFTIPVLFTAFGYHTVIPSLCSYLGGEKKSLRLSILLGTSIPLVIYLMWQGLVTGSASKEGIASYSAVEPAASMPWIVETGQYFAFFVIVTSMLGVAFSLIDFLADVLKSSKITIKRPYLVFITFCPPLLFAGSSQMVFDSAYGIAGGFGEAFLNGLIPPLLVWIGQYGQKVSTDKSFFSGKLYVATLLMVCLFVVALEVYYLVWC